MELVVHDKGVPFVFAVEGRIDTNTAPQFEQFGMSLYDDGATAIVVDMSKCEFVSSAGLRAIVALQKRATEVGPLVFRNVVPDVMDVFVMTGFDHILTFE